MINTCLSTCSEKYAHNNQLSHQKSVGNVLPPPTLSPTPSLPPTPSTIPKNPQNYEEPDYHPSLPACKPGKQFIHIHMFHEIWRLLRKYESKHPLNFYKIQPILSPHNQTKKLSLFHLCHLSTFLLVALMTTKKKSRHLISFKKPRKSPLSNLILLLLLLL